MNKLFTRIGVAFAGIAMAIGVGVAIGQSPRAVERVDAAYSTTMATTLTPGSKYIIGYTDSNDNIQSLAPFNSTTQINVAQTQVNLSTATQTSAWTISSATYDNQSGYTISYVSGNNTYYLYSGGSGSKKIKTVTSLGSLNALWDISYNANTKWLIKTKTSTEYKLACYNEADFRTYSGDNGNQELELYIWNDEQSNKTVTSITPTNSSLTLNAGTVITANVIGTVSSAGTSPSNNYTNYIVDIGTYANETFTKKATVTLGTTYVSYNTTYNALRLTANDYPTTAGGSTYASAIIPLTVTNIAASSFKIALSTAATTQVTSRTILEGASETLVVFDYTPGTNPGVDWSVSPSGVVAVNENGTVTTTSTGTATVTATSKVNNANGVKTTASVTYTVQAGPAYSLYFNGTNTGFGDVTAAAIEESETNYYTNAFNGLEWTLRTVSGDSANVRITEASSNNTYIQIGTTNNPATEFSLRSNVFGSTKTKVTSVSVVAQGASQNSKATISVTADDGTFTRNSQSTASLSGNSKVTYTFVSTAAYGHISLNFASVKLGIKIESIVISAEADTSNKGKAYAFASKVEPVSTCDESDKTALITEYNSLTSEVKAIADAITLYDRPAKGTDDYGETYKNVSTTVSAKMTYIISRQSNSGSNGSALLRTIDSSNGVSTTIVVIAAISTLAIGGFFFLRKRKIG